MKHILQKIKSNLNKELTLFEKISKNPTVEKNLFLKNEIDAFQLNVFRLGENKTVHAHFHMGTNNKVSQNSSFIEVWIVQEGEMYVRLFDVNGAVLENCYKIETGEILITYEYGGHEILSKSNALFVELKYFNNEIFTTLKFNNLENNLK